MENLDHRKTEYEQYCYGSNEITLLIDVAMEPKVEHAFVEYVEDMLRKTWAKSVQAFMYSSDYREKSGELEKSICDRLEETFLCAGIMRYEIVDVRGKDLKKHFCKKLCPGKNRNFYRITSEGDICICVTGDAEESAIAHLLKEVDAEMAELRIRKDPFQDEECRDCVYLHKCFGGRACDIEKYGRKQACRMLGEQ